MSAELARPRVRALAPRDFVEAAAVLRRDAKRQRDAAETKWRTTRGCDPRLATEAKARAEAMLRIAALIESMGDE